MLSHKLFLKRLAVLVPLVFMLGCKEDNPSEPPQPKCPCVSGPPEITFTHVPAMGSDENLSGCVCIASAQEYALAVFIKVGVSWWTKPYWASPKTEINEDGSWECDVTTGGLDRRATEFMVYLIPENYDPPLAYGDYALPAALDSIAVAKAQVKRQ